MKSVPQDDLGLGPVSCNSRSPSLPSLTLGKTSACGGYPVEIRSTVGPGEPSSISLGERVGVHDATDAVADGNNMAGVWSPASLGGDFEVNGPGLLSMKDKSRFKRIAILECELHLSIEPKMAHSLRKSVTKRRYM